MSLASALSRLFRPIPGRTFPVAAAVVFSALSAGGIQSAHSQTPGSIDPNFNSQLTGGTVFSLYRYDFVDAAGFPRDYLVVGGGTTTVTESNGAPAVFGRLQLPMGVYNTSDNVSDFGNLARTVYTVVQDKYTNPDKFFAGGNFGVSTTQTTPRQNVVRINSDFTLDSSSATDGRPAFDPGDGANGFVTAILPTADGKLVVGGLFSQFNNQPHLHIVRLTDNAYGNGGITDGTIDTSFGPDASIDDNVLALAEQLDPVTAQPNGQILVGGLFLNVNNTPVTKLARLNNNGSVDLSFRPAIDARVNTITVQPDGKILIGGDFQSVNGVPVSRLARLNFDGTLDRTFSAGVAQVPSNNVNVVSVYTIVLLTDGRMYVGGNFITVNGVPRQYLALLGPDGSVDPTFDPGTSLINAVQTIIPDTTSTGDLLVGETINPRVNNIYPPSLVALYPPPLNTPAYSTARAPQRIPAFFTAEIPIGNGFYYLAFVSLPAQNVFGYYYLGSYPLIYHTDLGFEYVFDANDGQAGIYLYDYASGSFFYTSPVYAFPYLYDFSLQSVLYYFPVGDSNPGHYTTGPRYFFNFSTGQIFTK